MGPLAVIILTVILTCDSVPMTADESKEKEEHAVGLERPQTVQVEAEWLNNYRKWYYNYISSGCPCGCGDNYVNNSSKANETLYSPTQIEDSSQDLPVEEVAGEAAVPETPSGN